jgi:methyltransferase-like protein
MHQKEDTEVTDLDPQSDSDCRRYYSDILTKRMYHMNCVTRDSVRIKCQFNLVNRKVEFFHVIMPLWPEERIPNQNTHFLNLPNSNIHRSNGML